jgi:hypothetical protein
MKYSYALVAALALAASFATAFATETVPGPAAAQRASGTKVGDRVPDGTIYAGTSPETDKALHTTPGDEPRAYNWDSGSRYCADLQAHGHHDWRVPTKGELNVLFQNRDAIGGFNISGSYPAVWYWSSSQFDDDSAWDQRFSDGSQGINLKRDSSSLRCVR